jgi:hypothetical protein
MAVMDHRRGQAAVEYVALLAVLAAVLLAAGPAVGAPDIPRGVVHGLRLGLCIVGGDLCTAREAAAAALPPCPLAAETRGSEVSVTFLSVEVGARGTLAVTRRSDGSVLAAWSEGGKVGVSGGFGAEGAVGPLHAGAGAFAGLGVGLTGGRGWTFPDELTAQRFLHALPGSLLDGARWPPDWISAEAGAEAEAMVGAALGRSRATVDVGGAEVTGALGAGVRVTRARQVTVYLRASLLGPGVELPLLQAPGRGRTDLLAEYTFDRAGPRSLVFRRALPGRGGNRLTEVVATLDLRDPANWAVARPVIARLRGPAGAAADVRAVLRRIRVAGTTELYTSAYNDSSSGVSAAFGEGLKVGGTVTLVHIRKRLLDARAWTPGSGARARADCLPQEG